MNFHYIFPDKIIQPGNDPLPDVDYSESYEKKVWSAKKQYDDMLKTGKLEESDIERNCIEPLITIEAAQLVEGLL